jgi:MFS family permease
MGSIDFEPTPSMRGLLNAIMSVGSICAIPISPWLADWRGRRVAIIIGVLVMFVGVALQSASVALGMFIFARFLVGHSRVCPFRYIIRGN